MASEQQKEYKVGKDWMTRPDVAKLITDQTTQEILLLKEHLFSKIECANEAINSLKENTERQNSEIFKDIENLTRTINEKIKDIEKLIKLEIDHQTELREQYNMDLRLITEAEKESITNRLEQMNNLRQQIEKERGSYLSRDLYDREHKTLSDKVEVNNKALSDKVELVSLSQVESKTQLWFMGAIITVIISVISISGEIIIRLAWPGK